MSPPLQPADGSLNDAGGRRACRHCSKRPGLERCSANAVAHGSLRRMVTWRGWGEAAGEPAYPRNENAVDGVEAPWG